LAVHTRKLRAPTIRAIHTFCSRGQRGKPSDFSDPSRSGSRAWRVVFTINLVALNAYLIRASGLKRSKYIFSTLDLNLILSKSTRQLTLHVVRMPLVMKTHELSRPKAKRRIGAQAIVQVTDLFPQLIQQPS
jgi:hypothetical protein